MLYSLTRRLSKNHTKQTNQYTFLIISPSTNTRSGSTASKEIIAIVPPNSPTPPYLTQSDLNNIYSDMRSINYHITEINNHISTMIAKLTDTSSNTDTQEEQLKDISSKLSTYEDQVIINKIHYYDITSSFTFVK